MKKALLASNGLPAIYVSETGELSIIGGLSDRNARLMIKELAERAWLANGKKYLEFKTADNTHEEAEMEMVIHVLEDHFTKVTQDMTGCLPQNLKLIRRLVRQTYAQARIQRKSVMGLYE